MAQVGTDPELIGWTRTGHAQIFHRARTANRDGTGISRCGADLIDIGPRSAARAHERECADCYRPTASTAPARRRPQPTPTVDAPINPDDIKITPGGGLAIKLGTGDWIALDLDTGETGHITARQAKGLPTLRSRMPTVDVVGVGDLAAALGGLSSAAVSQLQKRHPDFPPPNIRLAGWPGWYPERIPEIQRWNTGRGGRRGRPPADQNDDSSPT